MKEETQNDLLRKRELQLTWTNKVEVWKEYDTIVSRPSVWEGTNQDGKKVRVYIVKVEGIDSTDNCGLK